MVLGKDDFPENNKLYKCKNVVIKDNVLKPTFLHGNILLENKRTMIYGEKKETIEGMENPKDHGNNELWNSGYQAKYSVEQLFTKEMEDLKNLEDQFQKTLSQYSETYKTYIQDMMTFLQKERNPNIGKIIQTPNGNKYYVNNFGEVREYSQDNWNTKHSTCNLDVVNVANDNIPSMDLTIGRPMNRNEPCGFEGQNIKVSTEETPLLDLTKRPGVIATQKTSYANNRYPAQNAIDGNFDTFNHTTNQEGTWWQVKFPKLVYIDHITIYNRKDCCRDRFTDVDVEILDEQQNIVWKQTIIRSIENQYEFSLTNIHIQGQYVRIVQETKPPQNFLHMGEVQVWGTEEVSTNHGKIGYVDKTGLLHTYQNRNMENTTGTCPTSIVSIDQDLWDDFVQGDIMSPTTLCALGSVDASVRRRIEELNNTLIHLSEQIYQKIESAKKTITNIDSQNTIEQDYLTNQLTQFQTLFDQYNSMNHKNPLLNAMVEDQQIKKKMNVYSYISWGTIALVVLLFTIRYMKK